MKRVTFLICLFILMLLIILIGYFLPSTNSSVPSQSTSNLTGDLATLSSLSPNSNIKTVAICNESNFCQDYKIICSNGQLLEKQPVEGAFIQHPYDWVDNRNIDYENLCEN